MHIQQINQTTNHHIQNHINLHFKCKQSIAIKSIKFIEWENISCKRKNTLTEISCRDFFVVITRKSFRTPRTNI